MLTLLLLAMNALFLFGMKQYFDMMADIELQQEVQITMTRIVDDLSEAKKVQQLDFSERQVKIEKRQNEKQAFGEWLKKNSKSVNAEEGITEKYLLHTSLVGIKRLQQIYKHDFHSPLTGNHAMAGVRIKEFFCDEDKDENKPGLVHLRLKARSEVTGHEYSMQTAIYIPAYTAKGEKAS